ncbi:hypothetical protein KJ885_04200 [Patescibacteria group bacterium]|nr:hypothetical protein [Patescibacteria group bacterium]
MSLLQRTLITTLILILFGVLIFVLIIQPTIADIKAFNDRIQLERFAIENKYTSRRNIKNVAADLKEVTAKLLPLMNTIIIQKGKEVSFISSLEAIAEKNNLTQKIEITPLIQQSGEMAQRQNIAITLSGNYIDTIKYLNDLEQSEFYIIIYGMNIGSAKDKLSKAGSSGTVKTNLQGYVYFSI